MKPEYVVAIFVGACGAASIINGVSDKNHIWGIYNVVLGIGLFLSWFYYLGTK